LKTKDGQIIEHVLSSGTRIDLQQGKRWNITARLSEADLEKLYDKSELDTMTLGSEAEAPEDSGAGQLVEYCFRANDVLESEA
jgi:hypothetical protein